MSHQQMLAWLDEASSYYVGDAAQRLKSVAVQLERIAAELSASMRRMDWEGEAEKAFVEWATNVANSTKGLADYSERGAIWMEDNSAAIASAQSAMPRYASHASAKENLEAALKYRNDPDSRTVAANAKSAMAASEELAAIEAKEKANKEAAAAEMERLSSAYQWSSSNMRNNVPPTFPPPPGAFVPDDAGNSDRSSYVGSSPQSDRRSVGTDTSTSTGTHTTRPEPDTRSTPDTTTNRPSDDTTGPTQVTRPGVRPDVGTEIRPEVPVDLGIDSVDTLPSPTQTTPGPGPTQGTPPPITKDGGTPPFVTTGTPPFPAKGGPGPVGPTGPVTGGTSNHRGPVTGGQRSGLHVPREGISGGRQVQSTQGRPATGLPRTTAIGTEQGGRNGTGMGRGPMGGGSMGGGGMGAGQNGISGGRRLAGETGGVVGGKAQRPGAAGTAAGGARPFTPGGSGLVRGGTPQAGDREDTNGERPDYLVEDEETWQQGNRRVAPPVID
ncbi:hypothetical protein [Streptomyces sp. WAC01280]|uniref:hypothetical protein n=1 Tax=Streptomyces sp. WAC01280 TaxID=2487424 RepID=UPI0021B048F0|nr:hypothetical protein [Streptomyces sp. WAC01280]